MWWFQTNVKYLPQTDDFRSSWSSSEEALRFLEYWEIFHAGASMKSEKMFLLWFSLVKWEMPLINYPALGIISIIWRTQGLIIKGEKRALGIISFSLELSLLCTLKLGSTKTFSAPEALEMCLFSPDEDEDVLMWRNIPKSYEGSYSNDSDLF